MKKKVEDSYLNEIIVSVIVVTYNDSAVISNVLRQTNEILSLHYPNYEIIVIDNNSEDHTLEKVQQILKEIPNIKIIRLGKTYSIDLAYTAGLDNCIGDYAVLLNIHIVKPQQIPRFLKMLFTGYDIASLRLKITTHSVWSPKGLLLSMIEKISKNKFAYEPIYLLAFNRKVINNFTKIRRKNRNFIYINKALGLKKITLENSSSVTNINSKEPFHFLEFLFKVVDIVIANSFKPLRLFTAMGIFFSFVFLLYGIVLVFFALVFNIYLIAKELVGLTFVLGIMFFLLFSILALFAEYIMRILDETRDEPLYFIADEIDKSIIIKNRNKTNII